MLALNMRVETWMRVVLNFSGKLFFTWLSESEYLGALKLEFKFGGLE